MQRQLTQPLDVEGKRLFFNFLYAAWLATSVYTLIYILLDIPSAATMLGVGVFVLSPLTWWLENAGRHVTSRYLLIFSANYYIFATGLAFDQRVNVEVYLIPTVMAGLMLGGQLDRKFTVFTVALPLLSWFLISFVPLSSLPFRSQVDSNRIDYFSKLNFFGAFAISILFLILFERMLRQQRSQMVAAAKMSSLGEMAGGIAHEINNPLAIIAGKAGLARARLSREPLDLGIIRSDLEKIEETVKRISKITKGLRAFARNSEKDPMIAETLDRVFADTLELCSEKFRNKNVKLSLNVPAQLSVRCRPVQLSQVFMNLLGNGLDAVEDRENPWVRIDVTRKSNRVQIRFTDAGNGIDPDVVAKMMNPFFTTKDAGRGTGLGLSISAAIIEEHDGRIFYDETSKNTCIVVELPGYHLGAA